MAKQEPIITDSGVVLKSYLDLTYPLDLNTLTPEQRAWLLDDSLTEGLFHEDEILNSDSDDGTMVESLNLLRESVIGHKIVDFEKVGDSGIITLDNGKTVNIYGSSDCCAYTEIDDFLLNADKIEHVITGVATTDGFDSWHIYADFGDILELKVNWSPGNAFYYGYGFTIIVKDNN